MDRATFPAIDYYHYSMRPKRDICRACSGLSLKARLLR